jgi:hypothetical protein
MPDELNPTPRLLEIDHAELAVPPERHLAARAEGRLPRDDIGDVLEGVGGVAIMIAAFLSPFLRRARSHWGVDRETANHAFPGDELVRDAR